MVVLLFILAGITIGRLVQPDLGIDPAWNDWLNPAPWVGGFIGKLTYNFAWK